jgi:hypothetical protein
MAAPTAPVTITVAERTSKGIVKDTCERCIEVDNVDCIDR